MASKLTLAYKKKKICEFILRSADKKIVDIYFESIEVEPDKEINWSEDKEFVKMLEKELAGIKSGKIQTIPWEEAKKQLLS